MNEKLQQLFFERIFSQFEKRKEAMSAISEVLPLESDSIYRRIRGETLLNFSELINLTKTFRVSLDDLLAEETQFFRVQHRNLHQPLQSSMAYLNNILNDFQQIKGQTKLEIYYASNEIPFFQYLASPKLAYFKLYSWSKAAWDFEEFRGKKFSFDGLTPELEERMTLLYQLYLQTASKEVWATSILDATCSQIKQSLQEGDFEDKKVALILIDELTRVFETNKKFAAEGQKIGINGTGTFKLYGNSTVHLNNTIFTKSDQSGLLYVTFDNPNYIKCLDKEVIDYMQLWFERLIKTSKLITSENEIQRKSYYNHWFNRLEQERQAIETLIKMEFF